jgi:hypothetical protein
MCVYVYACMCVRVRACVCVFVCVCVCSDIGEFTSVTKKRVVRVKETLQSTNKRDAHTCRPPMTGISMSMYTCQELLINISQNSKMHFSTRGPRLVGWESVLVKTTLCTNSNALVSNTDRRQ